MELILPEILDDLHTAERELQPYEKKYNMRSEFFYELFSAGFIEDAGNFDFQTWAGIYEIKIDREQLYKKYVLSQTPFRESLKKLSPDGVVA
ncbi:MAG: hypothetical protein ACT6FF_02505 [Methanosarcinaceae archaeon]